jgi:hypothetical protein
MQRRLLHRHRSTELHLIIHFDYKVCYERQSENEEDNEIVRSDHHFLRKHEVTTGDDDEHEECGEKTPDVCVHVGA